jgi:hypothetical protein
MVAHHDVCFSGRKVLSAANYQWATDKGQVNAHPYPGKSGKTPGFFRIGERITEYQERDQHYEQGDSKNQNSPHGTDATKYLFKNLHYLITSFIQFNMQTNWQFAISNWQIYSRPPKNGRHCLSLIVDGKSTQTIRI